MPLTWLSLIETDVATLWTQAHTLITTAYGNSRRGDVTQQNSVRLYLSLQTNKQLAEQSKQIYTRWAYMLFGKGVNEYCSNEK